MSNKQPTSRFRSDAAWSAAGTALPGVLGALIVPLLLERLGPAPFAMFALCVAVISFAPSFDFGIARTALRRMAALQGGDVAAQLQLSHECLRRAWVIGTIAGALLAAAALGLGLSSGPFAESWSAAITPLTVAALGVPVAIVANTQRSLLEGLRQFSASAGLRIALGVLTVLVPLALTAWTKRVEVLALSLVMLRAVAYFHQASLLAKLGLGRRFGNVHAHAGRRNGFWTESLWYAALGLLALLMSGFDRFVVAGLGGVSAEQLAILLAPQEIALRVTALPAALVPALLVRVVVINSVSVAHMGLVTRLFWLVGGAVFTITALTSVMATAWVPALFRTVDSREVIAITQVLLIGVFSNAIAQFPCANLLARGLVKDLALCHAAELPFFLVAVVVLVEHYGMLGAAACWSGRIVADTVLLLWRSNVHLPGQGVRHWQLTHGLTCSALTLVALWF